MRFEDVARRLLCPGSCRGSFQNGCVRDDRLFTHIIAGAAFCVCMQMDLRARTIYFMLLNVYAVKYARRTRVHQSAFPSGRRCDVRRARV